MEERTLAGWTPHELAVEVDTAEGWVREYVRADDRLLVDDRGSLVVRRRSGEFRVHDRRTMT